MICFRSALLVLALPFLAAGNCGGDDPGPCDVNPDADGDGHDSAACDGDDCDDTDAGRFPGNPEICDPAWIDEDCDTSTFGARDLDEDDAPDASCCNVTESGELSCGDDCDDTRPGVNTDSPEVCDFFDNDCDAAIDEGVVMQIYEDDDRDGHGAGEAYEGCILQDGVSFLDNDCDDDNPAIVPGAMMCTNATDYLICQEDGTWSIKATCPGQGCVAQPNGTGICI